MADGKNTDRSQTTETMPWLHRDLIAWSIVGMNHYHVDGQRRLFVAMVCLNTCIKAEGPDGSQIWEQLRAMARFQSSPISQE